MEKMNLELKIIEKQPGKEVILERSMTIKEIKQKLHLETGHQFAILVNGVNVTDQDEMEVSPSQDMILLPKIAGG